jgi:S-adenosylmethionine hydrolase
MAIITLTSDIGMQDYLVAAIKARLLQLVPSCSILDITHQVPAFNIQQAAYNCRNALPHFPDYSFHIILVNLYEKKPEQMLVALFQNQYILCPDNGLLSLITDDQAQLVMGLPLPAHQENNIFEIIAAMGKTILQLSDGRTPQEIGLSDTAYRKLNPLNAVVKADYIEGQIIYIDAFENVIVNITRTEFETLRKGRSFRIVLRRGDEISQISQTYADVPAGEMLARFNSAGYLEIAINKGNAAGLLGLKGFDNNDKRNSPLSGFEQNRSFYQTVRVYFE